MIPRRTPTVITAIITSSDVPAWVVGSVLGATKPKQNN